MTLTPEQRADAMRRALEAPPPSPRLLASLAVFFRDPEPAAEDMPKAS